MMRLKNCKSYIFFMWGFLVLSLGSACSHATKDSRHLANQATQIPQVEPLMLFSDVDDTVKITHVEKAASAVGRGLFYQEVFGGMAKLYGELLKDQPPTTTSRLHFLSGSPDGVLNKIVAATLTKAKFPDFSLTLKDWSKWGMSKNGTKSFKKGQLSRLVNESPLPVILFGDDTELDPEAYTEFLSEHPEVKAHAVYIHRMTKKMRPLPKGVQPYFTAFDIALHEFHAGRLTEAQVELIGETVIQTLPHLLFHHDSHCPRVGDVGFMSEGESEPLSQIQAKVTAHIEKICVN